jgi:glycosyltransferase involved in cell wall biosynthesis
VRAAGRADAVYLLKVASRGLVDRIRRETSARIIFDLTDALWRWHHWKYGWWSLNSILVRSDAVVVNHSYTLEYAQRYNRAVYVVPDVAPLDKFDAARKTAPPRRDDTVVIGWMGSPGTVRALKKVFRPLQTIGARHPCVSLHVLGCSRPRLLPPFSRIRYRVVPSYDEATMIREILAMDIGIFPPPLDMKDYCIRGRLKAMLYMAGGAAPVLQDAEHCRTFIRDGENGMLAGSEAEWTEKIEQLVVSPELRRSMGEQAIQTVRAGYTTRHAFEKLRESIVAVLSSPRRPA